MLRRTRRTLRHCLLLAVVGCASPTSIDYSVAGYEQVLNSWLGASVSNLVRSWGAPAQRYDFPDGGYLLRFSERGDTLVGPSYARTVWNPLLDSVDTAHSGMVVLTFRCETEFEIQEDRVVRWKYGGNDCRAREEAWIGLTVRELSSDDLDRLGIRREEGLVVTQVVKAGPAWNAGLRNLDVILGFAGRPANARRLRWFVEAHSPGDFAVVEVWSYSRKGTRFVTVTLGLAP